MSPFNVFPAMPTLTEPTSVNVLFVPATIVKVGGMPTRNRHNARHINLHVNPVKKPFQLKMI